MNKTKNILAKLAFNGYNVRYHDIYKGGYHETRFETLQEIEEEQIWPDFPCIDEFIIGVEEWLSSRFIRRIMWIYDNDGNCLYMNPEYEYARKEYYP